MNIIKKQLALIGFFSVILLVLTSFLYVKTIKVDGNSGNHGNNQASNFSKFFPDKGLARLVADALDKNITDKVTVDELANIKGYFEVGPGEVSDLTGIGYLIGIDSFNCYKNEVTVLPPEIGKCKNLISLDLCKAYFLKKIPAQIGDLKKLKRIRLSLTEVNSIPNEIGNLSELEILWICCNNLSEIPKEVGNLHKLLELDIHSNKITQLPKEICNLTSLVSLDLSHCGLKELPENIGNLKALVSLNLFNNDIKVLPKSIAQLDNLKELNVYDNFKLSESYKRYLPKLLQKQKKE